MLKKLLARLGSPPIDAALKFGGFVLAHAAVVANALEPGDLICPFAVVTKGSDRQILDFEADSQAKAIERGKASLGELKDTIDLWAFAREGLYGETDKPESKVDALVISAWTHGMAEPVNLLQRFRQKQNGFALFGPIEVIVDGSVQEGDVVAAMRTRIKTGIAKHPQGGKWGSWLTQ